METPRSKPSSSRDALNGLWTIGLCTFVIALLYFGREILTPIALAALLTFLLSPLVTRLQKWVGRICAVLLVVIMMLGLTVGSGWILTRQIVDLGAKLPDYKENIRTKLKVIKPPSGGAFDKLSDTFADLKKDLPIANDNKKSESPEDKFQKLEANATGEAIPVEVVATPDSSPLELFKSIAAPILGPLGTSALVLLLMVFMLLQREDLRNRLIRLVGQGRISMTTSAMDDAAARVSRYLLMQLVVNVTYGMGVALGLWIIGVPNAILWGTFATVLRFIPYLIYRSLSRLVDANEGHRLVRRFGTCKQQCDGTLALWFKHRSILHRADCSCCILDLSMGTRRARYGDSYHRLYRGYGEAHPTARIPKCNP
jgi:predicted PurR-regulated permease PerM